VAEANRQTAPRFVYLKVVSVALGNLGLSDTSVTRGIFQGCGDGSIRYLHAGAEPPPGFWRTGLDNVTFRDSDIINMLVSRDIGIYTFTLCDVRLAWEDVVVKYPELGAEPPELGTSRVEVTAAPSLMQWFGTLGMWLGALRRKPTPPAEEESRGPATPPASASVQPPKQSELLEPLDWLVKAMKDRPQKAKESKDDWAKWLYSKMKLYYGKDENDEDKVPWGDWTTLRRRMNDPDVQRRVNDPSL